MVLHGRVLMRSMVMLSVMMSPASAALVRVFPQTGPGRLADFGPGQLLRERLDADEASADPAFLK
jgi:hypothetical protein